MLARRVPTLLGANSLKKGLVAYWKLDEASGTRSDSRGTNHLTDTNTVTQAAGKIGSAAEFTAANSECLELADNAALSTGDIDFTISAWVYPTNLTGAHYIINKYNVGGVQREYLIYTSGTLLVFELFNAAGSLGFASKANMTTDTWWHIIAMHDSVANKAYLFVNGVESSGNTTGGPDNSTAGFGIGCFDGAVNNFYDGRVDEVGFWKRTLTARERATLYSGGTGRSYPF